MYGRALVHILPFFCMGFLLAKIKLPSTKKSVIFMILSFIAFLGEVLIVTKFDLKKDVAICLSFYPLIFFIISFAINFPLSELSEKIPAVKYCSDISSQIYFSHTLLRIPFMNLTYSLTFVLTAISSIVFSVFYVFIKRKRYEKRIKP
jgi:hypothetical protein